MPSKKMSASRMHKLLQAMHPQRYDIPTENQVKQFVSSLVVGEKKKKAEAAAVVQAENNSNGKGQKPNATTDSNNKVGKKTAKRVSEVSFVESTSDVEKELICSERREEGNEPEEVDEHCTHSTGNAEKEVHPVGPPSAEDSTRETVDNRAINVVTVKRHKYQMPKQYANFIFRS